MYASLALCGTGVAAAGNGRQPMVNLPLKRVIFFIDEMGKPQNRKTNLHGHIDRRGQNATKCGEMAYPVPKLL